MTSSLGQSDLRIWRPQPRFQVTIDSKKHLQDFNDTGGIAVFIDVAQKSDPDIEICGSQNQTLSFWHTRSRSGFVTRPKFSAGLLTLRFMTSGQITYSRRGGETAAAASIATLTGFDELREVRASCDFSAISATLSVEAILAAHRALNGQSDQELPRLEPIAPMEGRGMTAFFCSVRSIQRRLQEVDELGDLMLPLLQEILSYQLLSVWPKQDIYDSNIPADPTSRQLRTAIDFIEANLGVALTLVNVAEAAGIGVRSLQNKFKKELGQTPLQFIIERRLKRVREEIISQENRELTIADIAKSWGFVHMPDFGQRYRRFFGCTPSQTRADARRGNNQRRI